MQWHPLFAQLLRPVVESYYEVQTNVPVGDVPREADLVLLRRKSESSLPFRGIWAGLTSWNILEFKSPDVRPQVRDLELLVELGLGIDRRLSEERTKHGPRLLEPQDVSFWYLANRLSVKFLKKCERRLISIASVAPGVWQSQVLERRLMLVSRVDLPVDHESLPLHIVSLGRHATELAMARLVVAEPTLRQLYQQWVFTLHHPAWKEVQEMSSAVDDEVEIDLKQVAEYLGVDRLVKQVGLKRMIEEVGLRRVIAEAGLRQVIAEVGLKQVIAEVGLKQVIAEVGLDQLLASLTAAQRRELKRRLR